ncbi:hypothetical protein GDO81_026132 [Engystomops pustulosus]|uniref:Uncharacterized protein n=1 Tax=Engystomops pustulosus TaxID=76066 RepID=A0AAV6ZVS5_ENGPU|nr:hypothetical protein GDO81_026132 [Engystomops pustulosus]
MSWSRFPTPAHALEASFGGGQISKKPTLLLMEKIWTKVKAILGVPKYTPLSPIWRNSALPEIFHLEGFSPWENKGSISMDDLC